MKRSLPTSSPEKKWLAAETWVKANMALVRGVAAPYRSFMASDLEDIQSQAILAAYEALVALEKRHDGRAECFQAFFRVVFKRHCLRLSAGGQITLEFDLNLLPMITPESKLKEESSEVIKEILDRRLPDYRQRQVCHWILSQPHTVGTGDVAEHFGLDPRYIRQLIVWSCKNLQRVKEQKMQLDVA